MSSRGKYQPGPATGAEIDKSGETWALVLIRDLRHPPERVWKALTDPAQLSQWAPFDAERSLAATGPVKLTTIGAPPPQGPDTVRRAEEAKLLEYSWAGNDVRWELAPLDGGTRLKLWININRRFIAWGAAGWQICFDVLERLLAGDPIGRIAGPEQMKLEGWQRLAAEYSTKFGIEPPSWGGKS